jgi:hypothetical protein
MGVAWRREQSAGTHTPGRLFEQAHLGRGNVPRSLPFSPARLPFAVP